MSRAQLEVTNQDQDEKLSKGSTMLMQEYEIHPAADLFPMMTEDEYEGLKQDIAENGQREDIVVWRGKLIDGRNRLRACEELQRQPIITELDEEQDPWKYVISHNFHRRHLTTAQRSMVAAKMATLKRGRPSSENPSIEGNTTEDAAKLLNVGHASVERAKQVLEHGSKELVKAVERGDVSVSAASQLVKAEPSKAEQAKIVKQGDEAIREKIAANVEKLRNDLIEQDRKDGKQRSKPIAVVSSAMEFATMAIVQLQRIPDDDEKCGDAYQKVRDWMDRQEASR